MWQRQFTTHGNADRCKQWKRNVNALLMTAALDQTRQAVLVVNVILYKLHYADDDDSYVNMKGLIQKCTFSSSNNFLENGKKAQLSYLYLYIFD